MMIIGLERGHSNKNEYTISSVGENNANRMRVNDHSNRSPNRTRLDLLDELQQVHLLCFE